MIEILCCADSSALLFTIDKQHTSVMRHLLLALLVACSSTNTGAGSKPDPSSHDPSPGAAGSSSVAGGTASPSGGSPSKPDGSSNDPSPNDHSASGTSGGGDSAVGATAGDSCNKIFTCVGECTDDSCANDCYAKGSAAGQQTIDALLQCLDTNGCTDATCAKMYCQQEIDACTNDVTVNGNGNGGPPVTQGDIDPSLVGDWMAHSISYHFSADGSYFMAGLLAPPGMCLAFDHIDFIDHGVAQTQGNVLATTATTSKQVTTDCAGNQTTKTTPGDTKQFTWSISGSTLTMVGDTGSIDYQKQ